MLTSPNDTGRYLDMRRTLLLMLALGGVSTLLGVAAIQSLQNNTPDMKSITDLAELKTALQWRSDVEIAGLRYQSPQAAIEDGFLSLGDNAVSRWEHYVKWSAFEDTHILDPNFPEILMYRVEDDRTLKLAAYAFTMPARYTLTNTPAIGDGSGEWHSHFDVCLAGDPFIDPRKGTVVAAFRGKDGGCDIGVPFPTNIMIHAWVIPDACGPFSVAREKQTGAAGTQLSGINRHGKVPACLPELARAVWPAIYG